MIEFEEIVPTMVTVDENGMAQMDARYWMEYARRANAYRNGLRHAREAMLAARDELGVPDYYPPQVANCHDALTAAITAADEILK